jgi:hypothetical protein
MMSLANKCCTDTSVLPFNILSLQGFDFFTVIERLTSDAIVDLIRIQCIQNVRIFMLVPNVLGALNIKSEEIDDLKDRICFRGEDNVCFLKPGIKASLQYLRKLFATKLHEHYYPNSDSSDILVWSNDTVSTGEKRAASLPSIEQVTNKRRRT